MGGNEWADKFYAVIKYGKGALLVLLLAGAVTNGHKEYIEKNPRKFVWDSVAVGGLSAVAIVLIAMMRGRSDMWVQLAMISFLLFFFYNVVRELSGFNSITDPSKLTQGEAKQAKVLKWPTVIIVMCGLIVMIFLAVKARVLLGPDSAPGASFITRWTPSGRLAGEAALLGLATAVGEVIVAKNHHESTDAQVAVGATNFMMFAFGHMLLQWGGFYSHVFSPAPPCIY
jgi:hypothetical protein